MNINFFLKKIIIKYLKFFYIFYDLFIRHRIFINSNIIHKMAKIYSY